MVASFVTYHKRVSYGRIRATRVHVQKFLVVIIRCIVISKRSKVKIKNFYFFPHSGDTDCGSLL